MASFSRPLAACVESLAAVCLLGAVASPAVAQPPDPSSAQTAAVDRPRPRYEFGISLLLGPDPDPNAIRPHFVPRFRVAVSPWSAMEIEGGWAPATGLSRRQVSWAAVSFARDVLDYGNGRVVAIAGGTVVSTRQRFGPPDFAVVPAAGFEIHQVRGGAMVGAGVRHVLGPRLALRAEARLMLAEDLPIVSGSAGVDVPIGRYPLAPRYPPSDALPSPHPLRLLPHGRRVFVTTVDGREVEGEWVGATITRVHVRGLTGDALIALSDVTRVETPDRIRKSVGVGAAIGAAGGAGFGAWLSAVLCESEECGPQAVFGLAGIGAAIGAVAGAIGDSAVVRRERVFDAAAPNRRAGLIVAPYLTRRGWAFGAKASW